MTTESIQSLYGKAGTVHIETIRVLCRGRIEGMNPSMTHVRLGMGADKCEGLAKAIASEGGAERIVTDLEDKASILEWWQSDCQLLHQIVNETYTTEYIPDNQSEIGGGPSFHECPYEDQPNGTNCWGCHVPRKVWARMKNEYER